MGERIQGQQQLPQVAIGGLDASSLESSALLKSLVQESMDSKSNLTNSKLDAQKGNEASGVEAKLEEAVKAEMKQAEELAKGLASEVKEAEAKVEANLSGKTEAEVKAIAEKDLEELINSKIADKETKGKLQMIYDGLMAGAIGGAMAVALVALVLSIGANPMPWALSGLMMSEMFPSTFVLGTLFNAVGMAIYNTAVSTVSNYAVGIVLTGINSSSVASTLAYSAAFTAGNAVQNGVVYIANGAWSFVKSAYDSYAKSGQVQQETEIRSVFIELDEVEEEVISLLSESSLSGSVVDI